jgi:hypothetical protein
VFLATEDQYQPLTSLHSTVGVGVGIAILRKSKKIQSVEILGPSAKLDRHSGGLQALIHALNTVLKRLSLSGIDLSGVMPLLDGLSLNCQQLEELKLCSIGRAAQPIQWVLSKLLHHSMRTLQRLSIKDVNFSPSPLPTELFPNLQYLSVSCLSKYFSWQLMLIFIQIQDCGVNSEGCLEELFRKCPLLEEVVFINVWTVTDRTLLVVAEYCTRLQQVRVEGCPLVGLEAIDTLHGKGVGTNFGRTYSQNASASKRIPGQI